MEYLVSGDTAAAIVADITKNNTNTAEPLDSATTVLKVRLRGSDTVLFTVTGENGDLANGNVLFPMGDNMTGLAGGFYEGEIEVTYADASIQSVYEVIRIQVRDDF
jgi:hypothetical protein